MMDQAPSVVGYWKTRVVEHRLTLFLVFMGTSSLVAAFLMYRTGNPAEQGLAVLVIAAAAVFLMSSTLTWQQENWERFEAERRSREAAGEHGDEAIRRELESQLAANCQARQKLEAEAAELEARLGRR